jgi:putative membrane protein
MKDDHEEDVNEFKKAGDAKDADLKAFAVKTLPIIQMHLDMVKAIDESMN